MGRGIVNLDSEATDVELAAQLAAILGTADASSDTLGELATLIGLRMAKSANLSDVANVGTALTNLGLSAFVQTLLNDADADTARNTLAAAKRHPLGPAGVVAETFPRPLASANLAALTTGTLRLVALPLEAGQTVTSLTFTSATTALSGATNQWFSLFSPARALLRVTNDDTSAAWAANTPKPLTCTTPYVAPASGLYYAGIVVVATTVPTLLGLSSSFASVGIPPILGGNSTASLTDPASAPVTAAAISASGLLPYAYAL